MHLEHPENTTTPSIAKIPRKNRISGEDQFHKKNILTMMITDGFVKSRKPPIELSFPRALEADGSAEKIREALAVSTILLWQEGQLKVPLLRISAPLAEALQRARLQRRISFGFEDIAGRLAAEKKGIDAVRKKTTSQQQNRVSRLLLFSRDGAQRLYRHIEQILIEHQHRLLGCRLDTDSKALGKLLGVESNGIKVILVEHKDAVSDVLRALVVGRG